MRYANPSILPGVATALLSRLGDPQVVVRVAAAVAIRFLVHDDAALEVWGAQLQYLLNRKRGGRTFQNPFLNFHTMGTF
jgi:hypothetical protein